MERVRAGDRAALGRLYRLLSGGLFNYLRKRGANPDDAADVLHDAFLKVWRHRKRFRGRGARPWIYTIARNAWIDTRTRAESSLTRVSHDLVSSAPSAEDEYLARELADRIHEALAGLPEATREVILLSRYSAMSSAEIAEVLEMSQGNVAVRLHRGLKALKEVLDG